MGDKFYTNIDGRPTLQELTAAGVSLLDSGGYYSSNNLEDLAIELYGRSNKNYCINGNFDIWQRGTSFTNPANWAYTADRINQLFDTNGGTPPTITHSRQILTPGELNKSFYFYRINANGAGSGYGVNSYYVLGLQQIENGTQLLCGLNKKVTISFYIKSDIAGRVVTLEPVQHYGTGGSPSATEILTPLRITCNATWTKVAYTFTTNTLSGKTFGTNNDDRLQIWLWLQGGSTYNSRIGGVISWASGNIDIAQVQINAGDTALDYVAPVPALDELKCLRYYENSYTQGHYPATATYTGIFSTQGTGNNNSNRLNYSISFLIPKRIIPVVHTYDAIGNYDKIGTYDNAGTVTNNVTASAAPYQIGTKLFKGQHVVSGSGLIFHWTADAEF